MEVRKVHLTIKIAELLKQNGALLKMERENRVEVDAVRKEIR